MSRGSWRVKPTEIARTVRSVQSTGLNVRNVEISADGVIRINVGEPDAAGDVTLDRELADFESRHGQG
jgi:hypothetical protein